MSYAYRARKKAIKRAKRKHDTTWLEPRQMPKSAKIEQGIPLSELMETI